MIAKNVSMSATSSGAGNLTATALNFTVVKSGILGMDAELVAQIPPSVKSPYVLEGSATWGYFKEGESPSLLRYYLSADKVLRPNDWFGIQDLAKSELEITLRDPYMKQLPSQVLGRAASRLRGSGGPLDPSGDQCPPGAPFSGGGFCIVAVVRFNGTLVDGLGGVNVTTFSANGTKLGTAFTPDGVVILRYPNSSAVGMYASVNYREQRNGTIDGKRYEFVDHWATTFATLQR